MLLPKRASTIVLLGTLLLAAPCVRSQTETNLAALRGLAPVSALQNTGVGKAALAANLAITGGIENGTVRQPTLLPLGEHRQQALRDGFITGGNADDLADGLGRTLGDTYRSMTSYTSADDGKTSNFTNISPTLARLFLSAFAATAADAGAGKYFFANATLNGKTPASTAAIAILIEARGTTDIFGKAYGFPGGSKGSGSYGNSRPFQAEPHFVAFTGADYFGVPSGNVAYLRGPAQDLIDSPSYPSGHTTYAYTEALVQADAILTATEGPGGGFLDNGSRFGVYSRLDLYRAAERAIAVAPRTEQHLGQ